jgi:large subunit ribosomal protein L29
LKIESFDKLKFVGQEETMKRREEVDKLRDMADEDLQAEAARLKESLFRLNFKLALGEIDAVKKMRQEKKSLARLRTIERERETQASK